MLDDQSYRYRIREIYSQVGKWLEQGVRLSPYDLGIEWAFSPIEFNVWSDIRFLGLPFYPEYPVGPYFIDFADPKEKIGIEVDSFRWHKNRKKDHAKDDYLIARGWQIHRLPSYITFQSRQDFIDDDGELDVEEFIAESSEGYLWNLYQKRGRSTVTMGGHNIDGRSAEIFSCLRRS